MRTLVELEAMIEGIRDAPTETGVIELIVRRPAVDEREVVSETRLDVAEGLAGDQIYADFDISIEHLPPGTKLTIGDAEIEVSEKPHTGCAKFSARSGTDALRFVNGSEGRRLRLRGMNTRVTKSGTVRVGDPISICS